MSGSIRRELSNTQIDRHFKNSPYAAWYGGCYCKDELKGKKPGSKFWIINLQNSTDGQGTHWTAVVDCAIDDENEDYCLYFDSFGAGPPLGTEAFMKKSNKPCVYTDNVYQSLTSENCGYYCIQVITMLFEKVPYKQIFDGYLEPDDPKDNEARINKVRL